MNHYVTQHNDLGTLLVSVFGPVVIFLGIAALCWVL